MTPVIPSSTTNISLIPGCTFDTKTTNRSIRCSNLRRSSKRTLYAQDCVLPLSTPLRLFPLIRTFGSHNKPRFGIASATGVDVDVAVEQADQPDSAVSEQDPIQTTEPTASVDKPNPDDSAAKSKQRSRPTRKSEMPPVKDEELVPGATFTGKVRSIQPFGAFIDFGAFTDGLVHVSRLSDGYVKDVANVVTVGQEVEVKLVEANIETGRIALTMRKNEPASGGGGGGGDPSRPGQKSGQKRSEGRKTTKFVKGQELEGTVKNKTRSGAFITLPEGEEGFLPAAEEADEGFGSIMGDGSSLEIGQEVKVRVLRIARGQVTLTMKTDEGSKAFDSKLQGKVFTATNPFLVAFRSNKDIASFLDEREKVEGVDQVDQESKETVEVKSEEIVSSSVVVEDAKVEIGIGIGTESDSNDSFKTSDDDTETETAKTTSSGVDGYEDGVTPEEKVEIPEETSEITSSNEQVVSDEIAPEEKVEIPEETSEITSSNEQVDSPIIEDVIEAVDEKIEPVSEENISVTSEEKVGIPEEANSMTSAIEQVDATPIIEENVAEETPVVEAIESQIEEPVVKVEVDAEIPADTPIEEPAVTVEVNAEIPADTPIEVPAVTVEVNPEIPADTPIEEPVVAVEVNAEIPADTPIEVPAVTVEVNPEIPADTPIEEPVVAVEVNAEIPADTPIEDGNDVAATEQPSPAETAIKATISPALVKQLREETGAGMMDCKRALSETEGDLIKAQEYLRKKGLASADKKASRKTAEGRIGSYVHDSRIGVLIEVNCETDFVSRGDIFKELVNDLAMQVAACPQVQVLVPEDVPEETVQKEKEIEMQKEDLLSKPEQIRAKIVEGRIKKRLDELALLEQAYIKNDKVVVKDFIKSTISTIGENIKVNRFVRFNLGEGLEKRTQDFAAEVAAQTSAKKVSAPTAEPQAAPTEAVAPTADEAPKAVISAALVKQLREETGAGMMDCKKALSETGGDLEKAQEYLRKKGLSTADKKSSRIAAEGRIGSYIHDARIGVLIEVNCETDFVGRSEKFKELVDDLAMQVVACPKVEYVSIEDIPENIVKKERELEMQREDILSKPENIREKIVEGRVSKRLGEITLLEQAYLKDDSVLVKDFVKQTVAAIGENIKVRRFVRFTLGESSESKSDDSSES